MATIHSTVGLDRLPYQRFSRITPDTSLSEAALRMDKDGLQKAAVMQGQTLLGILSSRDRLRAIYQQIPSDTPVSELMSVSYRILNQNTSISDACSYLLDQVVGDLVVIDDLGKQLGLLDEDELLRHAALLAKEVTAKARLVPSILAEHEDKEPRTWFESLKTPLVSVKGNVKRSAGFARDVTRRMEIDKPLRKHKRQSDLLSRFAITLINLPANSSDAALNHALKQMGELAQVDRAYIFRYDFNAGITCNTHEWCASGISPQIDKLQSVPLESIPDWVNTHKRAESLVVNDVDALPSGALREILKVQDIKSLVSLPIQGSDSCFGFLGLDSVRSKREYGPEDLEMLELFARTLANYQERVSAEQKLANSEANFHAFFDNTQDLLFVLSHQGNVVTCNRQAARQLEFSEDELCGQSVVQMYPDENHDEIVRTIEAMSKGEIDYCAIPMQTRSGRRFPVEINVVAGQWNDVPALFMVCRDLSEITASQEKFSKAFHLNPMPMAISDLQQGTFLEVNEAFSQVMGYGIQETIGSKISAMGLFDNHSQWSDINSQLQQLGQVNNLETPLRNRQGEIVYSLFNASVLELQGRQLMISQVLDISARKAAEEALDNERIQLRTLINSQQNLVWLKDPDGVYLACNSLFESLLGLSESEILGKTDLDLVEKGLAKFYRENDRLTIKSAKTFVNEEHMTFASNGRQGLFETAKTPIFNSNSKLIGVLGVSRDITNERQEEQKRRRIERELHQSHKMEALGKLSGGVAHEFNNMLAIILGYKDLLQIKLEPNNDPSTNAWLEHIDVAGVRAMELVRQLLSFSRPMEKQAKRMNLETGVRNAIVLSQSSLPSSIEIDFQPGSAVPDVQLDIGELQQMLTNLLVNARDAMDGKGRIEVTLQHTQYTEQECQVCHTLIEGDWVELSIADNGPGIDPNQLSRIFEPFYTTKAVGKGTGLGLSMVSSAVEHNGGHILLDTQVGEGTRLRLLFPPLELEPCKPTLTLERVETPSIKGGKVLVVDDEPALTEFLKEALELKGLHVVALNNSREALALLLDQEQDFDLLITDQTMPGMLGTELVIKAKTSLRDLKVLLCSGHSEQINADNSAEFGIDGFLEKPISLKDIVIAIDALSP